jgi:hypothetical protein
LFSAGLEFARKSIPFGQSGCVGDEKVGLLSALHAEATAGVLLPARRAVLEDLDPNFRSVPARVRAHGDPARYVSDLGFRVLGFQGFRVLGFRILGF